MRWFFLVICGMLVSFYSYSLELGPLVQEINVDSSNASVKITIRNNSSRAKLIDTQVNKLHFTGLEYEAKLIGEDVLIVSPPAFKLEPGQTQTVVAVWVSKGELSQSQTYSIQFSSVNNKEKKSGDNIDLLINYNAIVHIYSSSNSPEVKSDTASIRNGDKATTFSLINFGDKYTKLSDYDTFFYGRGNSDGHVVTGSDITSQGYDVFLPAKQKISISLPSRILPKRDYNKIILIKRVP